MSQPSVDKQLQDIKAALDEAAIVATTDHRGMITYANHQFCALSGYTKSELLGQNHRILKSGYHPPSFYVDLWETISSGNVWHGEIKNKAKDGHFYWVNTTIVPFLDDLGKPYQYISIRYDISERKRVEGEIRQLNQQMEVRIAERTQEINEANCQLKKTLFHLQESEKMRANFIAALTHDLRTPLVGQERALELMLGTKEMLSPRYQKLVEELHKSNQDLLLMVNTLLESFQLDAQQFQIHPQHCVVSHLVKGCFEELASLSLTQQMHLMADPSLEKLVLWADPALLKRVLMNLLGNALKNGPVGQRITLSGENYPDYDALIVSDTGSGIPAEDLPYLFDRYYTGDHTRKKIGSGLGLSICKMIMEQHRGNIEVESELGQGTRFRLLFPKTAKSELQNVIPIRGPRR